MGNYGELILTICGDMREPIGYIPHGLAIGAVFVTVCFLVLQKREAKTSLKTHRKRLIVWFLFVSYLVVLLETAFFSREPGSRTGVDFELFGTWGETVTSQGFVIENVLMFIPFGILLPGCIRFFKNGFACILAACLGSIGIEYMQYVTERGFCQLDDVVMNVIGATVGWLIFRIFGNRHKGA